uniref:Uncharacterized protein n=1 Tax=Rhizophora mucronata TaxID=61149 RepID=A0A2P2QZG6_RHIMU
MKPRMESAWMNIFGNISSV